MGNSWEYKVLTLKPEKGTFFAISAIPKDEEATRIINREGSQGWELVNAVAIAPTQPVRLFFKRPR